MNYSNLVKTAVAETKLIDTAEIIVQQIKEEQNGDFAVPCFAFAKKIGKNPAETAKQIAEKINLKNTPFERAQAVGGYLNFFLKKHEFTKTVLTEVCEKGSAFFAEKFGEGKHIGIDFSSVNLAKHFHIGHLRNTITGQAVANICEACGFKVFRLNYLGDYGTPFGEILAAGEKLGTNIKKCNVSELQKIYASSKDFAKESEAFKALGRKYFKDIVDGEKSAREKYDYIKQTTLAETQTIFDEFKIKFNSFNGEFYYSQFVPKALELLKQSGILQTSEGAEIVNLEEFGLGVAVIVSSEGYSLYLTRDIAAAMQREKEFKLDKLIYITGSEQILNFKQLFKILELLNLSVAKKVFHLAHGRYSLESGKLSSRDGAKALLKDIVEEAKTRALAVLEEKGKSSQNKKDLAAKIGRAALVFSALNYSVAKEIVFNIDRALSFEGETGPYLQYTYARLCSIFEKAGNYKKTQISENLTEEEFKIAKLLNNFADVLKLAATDFEPFYLTKHLLELAKTFNKFYNENRILGNNSRLFVCECVKKAFEFGFKIIGIDIIERM